MNPNIFKVANFNLFNLVLPEKTFHGNRKYSKEVYEKKINWIAGQLDTLKGNLVGFQEIFHEEALKEAIAKSNFYQNSPNLISANPDGENPNVGLLSTFPIISHEIISKFPLALDIEGTQIPLNEFRRPILKVEIQLRENLTATVFVAHLKSKRPDFTEGCDPENPIERAKGQARSAIRRLAEGLALREILMEKLKNRNCPVIVMGDLNDGPMAVSTQLISGEPPFRNMPKETKEKIWDVLLYHVKDIQARQSYVDYYYSHIHNGHYESLDHIMVSQEFVGQNREGIGKVIYVATLNDHLIDDTLSKERVPDWQSDHAQVVATIELKDV